MTTVAVTFQFRLDDALWNSEAALRRRLIRDLEDLVERYDSKLDKGHSFIGIDNTQQLKGTA